ncbi:MAG TPA: sugar ABC transporter permease [Pseudobacteroides sp.]|uniref:carbohydrate ABC transporter permease n=1 Tax=Pseudobacteroides sp. TaxID=1968840 RepID=UPI002F94FA6F
MLNKLRAGDKYGQYGYIFIAPFFVVLAIFTLFPMIYTLWLSFMQWDGSTVPASFVGFDNFAELIKDNTFWQALRNTVVIWLGNVVPQMIFAIGLAAILTDKSAEIKAAGFYRAIFYLPNLVTMASVGLLFYYILDWQAGSLNMLLMKLNVLSEPFYWLQDVTATRGAISFTLWWMWFGYSMIIFMAGIKAIPDDLYEAAHVDGANRWQTFRHITIPGIKGSIMYNIVTSVIGGLTIFDIPYVLTNGVGAPLDKALTLVMYMYNMTIKNSNYGYGATIYAGMFVIVVVCVAITFKLLDKNLADN